MPTHRLVAGLVLITLAAVSATAQTSYPMITHTTPVAVQRGQTTEITVEGQMSFHGVYKALFEGSGLSAEILTPSPSNVPPGQRPQVRAVKLKVTIAPDAAVGVREFRLASTLGVSSIGQLVVVDDPVVQEQGDNNTLAKANSITIPCVVSGRIEAVEDVDCYRFRAEAGQILTFEVRGARLQDKIHDLQKHADPILSVHDASGRELAVNDDACFADPQLAFTTPKAGDYFVQIRDSKYDGDARWVYALSVSNRPAASHVFPMAGNPGSVLSVEPIGSARAAQPTVVVHLPETPGMQSIPLDLGSAKTGPVPFLVSSLPIVLEKEPNDAPEQATPIAVPCGINGRIGARRDLDHFVFQATKDKAIRLEVKARRFGSPLQSSLDSVLDVMNRSGQVLATNDDLFGKDAGLTFTPPSDGDYFIRIRDLNSKGGPTSIYFLEVDWATPDFTLRCDPDKAMIGPGSSTAWFVHIVRQNGFAGPVEVKVAGLPKGVSVSSVTIPPSMTQGVLVLTAAADAPINAANVQVTGTAQVPGPNGKDQTLTRTAMPNSEIYLPGGGRGRFDVGMQTVAVTEPSDILEVQVSPKTVTLKPGEEVRIDVTLKRRPDYDKGVSLDVPLRHLGGVFGNPLPPGVTLVEGKSKTLLGTGSKGHVVLKAAPDAAAIDKVPISVLAHVSVNFVVKISYSSTPISISVRK